jgi:2-iminobutanoate/2-iminopropanoate deaminase
MERIDTEAAPAAIGPYSQAVRVGKQLWLSGQLPLDPATMQIVDGGIAGQTERVMENIQAVLQAAGMDWPDVVKTTAFLADMGSFAEFNAVYERWLGEQRPARSTIGVAALPKGALVEIEVIAVAE